MDIKDDLKPNKKEVGIFIKQMMETPGWKIFDSYMQSQLESSQQRIKNPTEPLLQFYQGQLSSYEGMLIKLAEWEKQSKLPD